MREWQAKSIRYAFRSPLFCDLLSLNWKSVGDAEALPGGNAMKGACRKAYQ
jgi:hypothetical protein